MASTSSTETVSPLSQIENGLTPNKRSENLTVTKLQMEKAVRLSQESKVDLPTERAWILLVVIGLAITPLIFPPFPFLCKSAGNCKWGRIKLKRRCSIHCRMKDGLSIDEIC
ncbi:uncharacterized protein LOC127125829 isoform X2 [Lathyrus oleraceus]|uniref:uncharacterized protein LOC127125829 isoform X2 n=1 Tax=Pisum sativum TaxID=3888 RepID=UPI0021CFD2B7|nr:uncharacterized protein LOC127125829 isoform X2 [Pisum sativum]